MFLNVFIPWAAPELRLEADRSYHFRFGREATSPHSVALSARCFQFFKWKCFFALLTTEIFVYCFCLSSFYLMYKPGTRLPQIG